MVLGVGLEPEFARGESQVRWHGAVKNFIKLDERGYSSVGRASRSQ